MPATTAESHRSKLGFLLSESGEAVVIDVAINEGGVDDIERIWRWMEGVDRLRGDMVDESGSD